MKRTRLALARTSVAGVAALLVLVSAAGAGAQGGIPDGAHPHGTRTGIDTVDRVLDAMETGSSLVGLLQPTPTECSVSPQIGGTWCPEGTPDGTVIDTIFGGGCEGVGVAVNDPMLVGSLQEMVDGGFFLYGVAAGTYGLEGGRHRLYITSGPGLSDWAKLVMGDDGIMAISSGCGETVDADFAEETEVVFAPFGQDGEATPAPPQTGSAGLGREGSDRRFGPPIVVGLTAAAAAGLAAVGWRRSRD